MKIPILGAALCLLPVAAAAQLPMTEFVRTYSYAHTRGFYFQAPIDFTVYALQVPDETAQGQYHVALYRSATDPTSMVSVTPVFIQTAVKSDQRAVLTTPVSFKTGEWFAVLGASGPNTGNLDNSYGGSGSVPSAVLGQPVGLKRLMLQTNLAASAGVGQVYTNTANIGRVRVFVVGQGEALPYGAGSGPNPGSLEVWDPAPPSIGTTAEMLAMPGAANNTGALLAIGLAQSNIVLPIGTFLNLPHLTVLSYPAIPTTGSRFAFSIPAAKGLLGVNLYFQCAELQVTAFSLTRGMSWTVNR
jgi:hypothetical protein